MATKSEIYQKDLKAWFITFMTHNTRRSERMRRHNIKLGQPVLLNLQEEVEITKYILQIKEENNLRILAYNICKDHVHMILVCEDIERSNIIRKIKSKSTYLYKKANELTEVLHLWAQKYNYKYIERDETLENMINYIINNRIKHKLPPNKGFKPLVTQMLCTIEEAFSQNQEEKQCT